MLISLPAKIVVFSFVKINLFGLLLEASMKFDNTINEISTWSFRISLFSYHANYKMSKMNYSKFNLLAFYRKDLSAMKTILKRFLVPISNNFVFFHINQVYCIAFIFCECSLRIQDFLLHFFFNQFNIFNLLTFAALMQVNQNLFHFFVPQIKFLSKKLFRSLTGLTWIIINNTVGTL